MDDNSTTKVKTIEKSEMLNDKQKQSKGISYQTVGTTLQALTVQLDENEKIISDAGKMSWMTNNIKMESKSQGLTKMVSRLFASESLFINEYKSTSGTGIIAFSGEQSGKIIPIHLDEKSPAVIFQRGAYLCSEENVERSTIWIKKFAAGMFGGKGFILQKIAGTGAAHLLADGEVVMYELKEGEKILVDQGNLVAYEETVDFDIQTVGGGVKNWIFGGEGIFTGSLTGPGKVWLQSRKLSFNPAMAKAMASGGYGRQNAATNPLGCLISIVVTFGFTFFIILMAILGNS